MVPIVVVKYRVLSCPEYSRPQSNFPASARHTQSLSTSFRLLLYFVSFFLPLFRYYFLLSRFSFNIKPRAGGTPKRSLLRHFATIGRSRVRDPMRSLNFFNLPNSSGRTRPWGEECGWRVRLTTSPPSMSRLSRNVSSSATHNPIHLSRLSH
jgi:hypothetical protein